MADNNKLSGLRLTLISAAIASGLISATPAASAEEANVSEKDMLTQAVALYEKLAGKEVDVPNALINDCGDKNLGKAVILGFKNTDEVSAVSDAVAIRKQDALTILYKTILSYDYSYALTSDEIDTILNKCYDNALIAEENRAAYAFMLKHNIVIGPNDTEPNKLITWKSCATLVDVIYDLFVQDVSFTVNNETIKIGSNAEAVISTFGKPQRIDPSDYEFDWYVYNKDLSNLMMVGVKEGRVCAFFTNSSDFSFGDIHSGDDYLLAYKYIENNDFRIFKNSDGMIDAVLYNPSVKSIVAVENSTYLRACELVDIINAQRAKMGIDALNIDDELYLKANSMVSQPKYQDLARDGRYDHELDGAQHEEGYDIFLIYEELLQKETDCFKKNMNSIGVSTFVDNDYNIYATVLCAKSASVLTTQPADIIAVEPDSFVVEAEAEVFESETIAEVQEVVAEEAPVELVTPQIALPIAESVIPAGEDLVVELAENVSDEYYVSIYSIEDDEYVVNSYIKPEDKKFVFTQDLFTQGKDYTISVSSASLTGTSEPNEFTIRYGEVPQDALSFVSPAVGYTTDNDYLDIQWQSELYSTFVLDIYDADGKLKLSEVITDINNITVNNVDAGTYYIYVTALRGGTADVTKAQVMATVTVELPEPVITEHILEHGEKFYPVYEDKEMGLLYFYDEEIIDVEQVDSNGNPITVKKKKITEKQVKNIAYYKALAMQQQRIEYFVGSDTLTLKDRTQDATSYSGTKMTIYDDAMGNAVVEEAKKYLGVPYVWGGATPTGFDCSGLVQYVYKNLGIELNRVSQDQVKQGMALTREQLMPGDLVFFEDNGDVHHVGIYTGDGCMIHAPFTGAVVSYQSIDAPFYKSQFCGGRRVY